MRTKVSPGEAVITSPFICVPRQSAPLKSASFQLTWREDLGFHSGQGTLELDGFVTTVETPIFFYLREMGFMKLTQGLWYKLCIELS